MSDKLTEVCLTTESQYENMSDSDKSLNTRLYLASSSNTTGSYRDILYKIDFLFQYYKKPSSGNPVLTTEFYANTLITKSELLNIDTNTFSISNLISNKNAVCYDVKEVLRIFFPLQNIKNTRTIGTGYCEGALTNTVSCFIGGNNNTTNINDTGISVIRTINNSGTGPAWYYDQAAINQESTSYSYIKVTMFLKEI